MSLYQFRIKPLRAISGLLPAITWVAVATVPTAASAASAPSELVVGRQAKIEGHHRTDGTFEAVQIVLRDVDHTVKIEGRIASVRPDKKGLTVLGFDVVLSADTTLYRGSAAGASRAQLTPNTWVEVKGIRRGQALVAERVRIKDAAEPTEELEATIEGVGAAQSLIVLGRQVIWSPGSTPIVDERQGIDTESARLRRDDDDQSRQPWRIGSRARGGTARKRVAPGRQLRSRRRDRPCRSLGIARAGAGIGAAHRFARGVQQDLDQSQRGCRR